MDKYQKEQENNARLQSDVDRLKSYYEQELAKLNSKHVSSEVNIFNNNACCLKGFIAEVVLVFLLEKETVEKATALKFIDYVIFFFLLICEDGFIVQ